MNKQRKVVITTTYNEMGIIIDTKAEEIAHPNLQPTCNQLATDCISRHAVSAWLDNIGHPEFADVVMDENRFPSAQPEPSQVARDIATIIENEKDMRVIASAQPEQTKYEYHYDHTDCIWYRPEARNRCPTTCAQYRDGWNDAMNYIFRDGKGYRPYRRDKQYGE